MGLEELSEVFNHFTVLFSNGNNVIAKTFAWIGIVLIVLVALYYLAVGVTKLAKAFWRMNVKYLGLVLLMLGIVFVAISLIIP
ncbi:hypothetical protein QPL79_03415 [Ignisphaera sp. 4213-co]|uniref:Uncharacterized protein n=1 Tax=Ignisphaera cupida TaxID=3050454 RepID=A0ABD4Z528_9CREN|nr:hypothetical protein [Ignisphaera sp. 4213-co]MDK6028411.1 hypothetical protein [Ignisphaera sp. 4213-co]